MEKHNLTEVSKFILMSITDHPVLQAPLFGLFLIIYISSIVGKLGMIIFTKVDSRLKTPMYFFLKHLALTDLGYSTAVGHKILLNFVVDQNPISYYDCATQLAFFIMFTGSELFILSAILMTAMWPSVTLYAIRSPCHNKYVGYWWQYLTSTAHLCLL
jgi:olfactory receptor